MKRLAIGIGLALALAAIGVGVAIAGSSGSPRAQAPRPSAAPPAPATTTPTTHVRSRPWRFGGLGSHGGLVVIQYTEGDCWVGARAHVGQDKKAVTIELLQSYTGGRGRACPQFLIIRTLSVRLQAPLGHRRLIHAPLGAPPG